MNQILAALIFFTRLPFWKIKEVPQECFKHVVNYWSFSGWLTGGMMALIFWGASTILPHGSAFPNCLERISTSRSSRNPGTDFTFTYHRSIA